MHSRPERTPRRWHLEQLSGSGSHSMPCVSPAVVEEGIVPIVPLEPDPTSSTQIRRAERSGSDSGDTLLA